MSQILNTLEKTTKIALVGSPNSGKTTLYNWLTSSHFKTVNYPGATIDYAVGYLHEKGERNLNFQVIDTPGIYSLQSDSEDEKVTSRILMESVDMKPDFLLLIVDSTQLERQFYWIKQVLKLGYPFAVVLTMSDIIEKHRNQIDIKKLSSLLNGVTVLKFDGLLGQGLEKILTVIKTTESIQNISSPQFEFDAKQIDALTIGNVSELQKTKTDYLQQTIKIDRWALHPLFGYGFFFVFMTLLFSSIYWAATPFMDVIDTVFTHAIELTKEYIPGLVGDFISDGVIAAIGGVIIFVPQIFILFVGIGVLESTGYLARVAALVNRPLERVGLGGRSFVPMLSGFACAIPAIMATRNISSKKEKLIAQLVVPFMACSARLPVFGLLIGFMFLNKNPLFAGAALAVLYFLSILVGVLASGFLSLYLSKVGSIGHNTLTLELPMYRLPNMKVIFRQSFEKLRSFVKRAGPVIFALAIVLWFATSFPRHQETPDAPSTVVVGETYASQLGKMIEPVFRPMGLDWRVGFGLISAFAAREVFVSSLALVFNIDGDNDERIQAGLIDKMSEAQFESGPMQGQKIFTFASCAGLLIFFIIALQCISTVAILKKETGSLKIALGHLVLSNVFAYAIAVAVFQTLSLF
jgi:ferrous iron transport protein B